MRNDIARNKAITLTIMIFVAAAAMLVSLAVILVINLSSAIDTLMTQAKTPHFVQMHSGKLDPVRLDDFVEQHSEIADYQVLDFLNIDAAEIIFDQKSLAGSVQDNGFSVQSKKFDYLLSLDGEVINVFAGEVYVPISYMRDGTANIGDQVEVAGKKFTVAGFLRDSQMNSLLSTSKRFLVNERDYAELREFGSVEYLIEFMLKDPSALGSFETEYITAGLEANGPTITYPLIKVLNAISDGLMIAVILLISALVVAIAFMCIRFTLLATIEEDYREIGVMKAIGLRVWDIKKIYLAKYAVIAISGSILGFTLSFLFRGMLLENIRLYMGESERSSSALLFGIIAVLFVFLVIIAYVNGVLGRFKKIPPAEAIRFGVAQEKSSIGQFFKLSTNRLFSTNVFLGMTDVLARKKLYATMLAVLVLAAFIIIVPRNLYNTISSDNIITHMGIGNSDIRIDIQQTDNISTKAAEIATAMEQDNSISKFVVLTTKSFRVRMNDGIEERIKVELGDHSIFPLAYSKGRAPNTENEIALSVTNADEMGKTVGDYITVMKAGQEKTLTVSGTYSDITNGGKTAKAIFTDNSADIMWTVINVELADESKLEAKVSEYARSFDFAKVSGIDDYKMQTFGSTIRSIGMASYAAHAVALTITVLITLLFMKMLVAKDRYSIAAMKAFGFTNSDIIAQYSARSVFVLMIGILLGTFLANTLGESLVGSVIGSFGASSFAFVVNPLEAYLIAPLLMVFSVLLATFFGTLDVEKIKIFEGVKE
jgi:putative ABC transport system permease protein